MPPHPDTPSGAGNRVRRSPRNAAKSNAAFSGRQAPSTIHTVSSETFQPSHILKRGDPDAPATENAALRLDPTPISTPPLNESKPRENRAGRAKKQVHNGNNSASEPPKPRKDKKKPTHSKAIDAPPSQSQKSTVPPAAKRTITAPAPAIRTPSKAYAGPKFHDSPDPSSLPPPIFLSRSVPNVNRTTSLSKMLANDSSESSSEVEGSPSQRPAARAQVQQQRDETPIDFLFRADKEAKARKLQLPMISRLPDGTSIIGGKPMQANGGSLEPRFNRQHVRHLSYNNKTEESEGEIFDFEMNAPSTQSVNGFTSIPAASKAENPHLSTADSTEEDRQTRTLALKKLLNVPISEDLKPSLVAKSMQTVKDGSPTPNPHSERRASPRLSGNLPQYPKGLEQSQTAQRQAVLSALEKHIAEPIGQPIRRPTSSGLRNEMKFQDQQVQASTIYPSSTLPPTRRTERPKTAPVKAKAYRPNGTNNAHPTAAAGNVKPLDESTIQGNEAKMKVMEDDLRRLLKLDVY